MDFFNAKRTDAGVGLFHILTTDIYRNEAEAAENC